jgi:hypothetical protein
MHPQAPQPRQPRRHLPIPSRNFVSNCEAFDTLRVFSKCNLKSLPDQTLRRTSRDATMTAGPADAPSGFRMVGGVASVMTRSRSAH